MVAGDAIASSPIACETVSGAQAPVKVVVILKKLETIGAFIQFLKRNQSILKHINCLFIDPDRC